MNTHENGVILFEDVRSGNGQSAGDSYRIRDQSMVSPGKGPATAVRQFRERSCA